MKELCRLSATELAALIAAREVSSRDVVEAHLDRIDEVNGRVNAVTVVLRASALEAADAADAALAAGSDAATGPLHGVPFTVKENIDCLGSATTHGIPALEDSMPSKDAPVVARMKAAGAIVIGAHQSPGVRPQTVHGQPATGGHPQSLEPALDSGRLERG